MSPTQPAKAALRQQVQARMKSLSASDRAIGSEQARTRLEEQAIWREADSILFYAPLRDEVNLWPSLLAALAIGKIVALPRHRLATNDYIAEQILDPERDLRVGNFGIREPIATTATVPLNRLDLILVPGLAFALNGCRLGRGMGFYDRWLGFLSGLTCGVAFDEQIVDHVPVEPHDVRLSCILTPTRWHLVDGARF